MNRVIEDQIFGILLDESEDWELYDPHRTSLKIKELFDKQLQSKKTELMNELLKWTHDNYGMNMDGMDYLLREQLDAKIKSLREENKMEDIWTNKFPTKC